MSRIYLLLLLLFSFSNINSQIINFPDQAFKDKLLAANTSNGIAKDSNGNNMVVDANGDDEIQLSEALAVYQLDMFIGSITSLSGIENFTNLTHLDCGLNQLTALDVSALTNLEELLCLNNDISTINVSGLSSLRVYHNGGNQLTTLNLSGLTALEDLLCDENLLTSLDVTGLNNLQTLSCEGNDITGLTVALPNITSVNANENQLATLDVNGSPNLQTVTADDNVLTSVTVDALQSLETLHLQNNNLSSATLTDLPNLQTIFLFNNQLSTIDVSSCTGLNFISVVNNQLETMFLKNGVLEQIEFGFNSTLEYICADDEQLDVLQDEIDFLSYTTNLNSYCTFVPGGTYYTVAGETRYDFNTDGCDTNDPLAPNMEFSITNGTNSGTFIANNTGMYEIPLEEGQHTITPQLEDPTYFTVSPASLSVDFPTDPSPFFQDFCIQPNGVHPDLEISIVPITPARPGFDADYRIVYSNKGNQIQSGTVTLTYMNDLMTFLQATPMFDDQTTNTFSWNYNDLLPFQSEAIEISFNINSPMATPPVNIDDILTFNAVIDPVSGDETPMDNTFNLEQTVVGSYDPNDITCLQGESVTTAVIGNYVHYLIRFENTGTFPAENVVIKDELDEEMFEVGSLRVLEGSHDFVTRIRDNTVEFIFEGINLPASPGNSQGYVLFKIKTDPGLEVGDSFSNEAAIYFDFNFPVITNTYVTTIDEVLATPEVNLLNTITVYPNPASETLHIATPNGLQLDGVAIYNMLGQQLYRDFNGKSDIDISNLNSGVYLIKVDHEEQTKTFRVIKR